MENDIKFLLEDIAKSIKEKKEKNNETTRF